MVVLLDIEWIEYDKGKVHPTQLAAIRVDENGEVLDEAFSRMRPQEAGAYQWRHIAYTGGKAGDYLEAPFPAEVLRDFMDWLEPEDMLCWWNDDGDRIFRKVLREHLDLEDTHPSRILGDYVAGFLQNEETFRGNPYRLAKARNLETPGTAHYAWNDAEMIRYLLEQIEFPYESLQHPPIPAPISDKKSSKSKPAKDKPKAPEVPTYYYDREGNIIHRAACDLVPSFFGMEEQHTLKKALSQGYEPCACCKAEYRDALISKHQKFVHEGKFFFIYAPKSHTFHRSDCRVGLRCKKLLGFRIYQRSVQFGLEPCKICNPSPEDEIRRFHEINGEEQKRRVVAQAIIRQKLAKKERQAHQGETFESESARQDHYTLTQPRFAFWAAKGYQTFHRRECSKLQGLSQIRGFARFSDARKAGFQPCKFCKPSQKQDLVYSIPITNEVRAEETSQVLIDRCKGAGYQCRVEGSLFHMETPAGKWIIAMTQNPITMKHINKFKGNQDQYHVQPRLFLSLVDAFDYIDRHDQSLLIEEGVGERPYFKKA